MTAAMDDPVKNNTEVIAGLFRVPQVERRKSQPKHPSTLDQLQQLRLLAESIPQLVWSCLPSGECEYLSRQWEEYTGIAASQQLGLKWLSLVLHPDDQEGTYAAWMAAVADRAVYDLDYRIRRHDGVYRWFRARGTPVRRADGTIERWFGTCTDIDDSVRANLERESLLERESESRRVAELLNQVGPRLLAELDPQKLAQSITDISTQLIGAEFGSLFLNASDENHRSILLYTLSGAPREAFEHFPMLRHTAVFGPTFRDRQIVRIGRLKDDKRFGLNPPYYGLPPGHLPVGSYLAVPVVSRSGDVLGALIFGHREYDKFTGSHEQIVAGIAAQAAIALDNARLFLESQTTQEALRRSNDDLRRANEDLNQFAYTASHDLQEPLRMVAIYSEILYRRYRGRLDADADKYLNFSIEGAQRMQLLVRDLLAYTQVLADAGEEGGSVDANAALEEAWSNLASAVEESGATLDAGRLPTLAVKHVHLVQLLQNLIGNAIKYRGNDPLVVHVSSERDGSLWRLCVRDNGIGIDPKYKEHVFGIFKRLHGPSQYPGTGIGLAICQKIVQRHGGRIWVESEGAGRGVAFCFTLPGIAAGC